MTDKEHRSGRLEVEATLSLRYENADLVIAEAVKKLENADFLDDEERKQELCEVRSDIIRAADWLIDLFSVTDGEALEVQSTVHSTTEVEEPWGPEDISTQIRDEMLQLSASLRGIEFLRSDAYEELRTVLPDNSRMEVFDLVKGALLWSSQMLTDELFEDLNHLNRPDFRDDGGQWQGLNVIGFLPPVYGPRYNVGFAQKLLIVLTDMSTMLAVKWRRIPSLAHELALHLILSHVDYLNNLHELGLPADWDSYFRDVLYEDADFELLFMPEMDGIQNSPVAEEMAMANLDFNDWFSPFNDWAVIPPYIVE